MDLSAIKIKVQADTKDAEKGLSSLKEKGDKLASIGGSLTLGVTAPIIGLGTASLLAAANVSEMESKFNTVFKTLASEADQWANEYAKAIGRSKNEIKETISNQADLYYGMGFTADEAFNLSKQVTQLGYDLASFNNVNDAQAVEAMQKALMGETESAKMLGVNLTDTIMETSEFTKETGKSWKELSMAEKAQVRYKEAVKQSSNAMGDAERTSGSFTNQMKRAKGNLQDLAVTIGNVLLPIFEPLITKFNEFLTGLINFATEHPNFTAAAVAIAGALAAVGPILFIIGKATALLAGVSTAVLLPIVAAAGVLAIAFVGMSDTMQEKMWELIPKLNEVLDNILSKLVEILPQIIQKGIDLVLSLVDGFIKGFPQVLAFLTRLTTNIISKLLEFMPKMVEKGWELIGNLTNGLINKMPSFLQAVIDGILRSINIIREKLPEFLQKGIEIVAKMIQGFAERVPDIISNMGRMLNELVKKIIASLPEFVAAAWDIVKKLVSGLWDNRAELFNIGKNLMSGLLDSILAIAKSFVNIGKTIVDSILSGVKSAWSGLTGWISSKLEDIPLIGGLFKMGGEDQGQGMAGEATAMAAYSRSPLTDLTGMLSNPARFGAGQGFKFEPKRTAAATGSINNTTNQNITINTPKHLSAWETAQEFKKVNRKLALSF